MTKTMWKRLSRSQPPSSMLRREDEGKTDLTELESLLFGESEKKNESRPCCQQMRRKLWVKLIFKLCFGVTLLLGFIWWYTTNTIHRRLCSEAQSYNQLPQSKPRDICFVTCIFGNGVSEADQPANVEWYKRNWCHVQFLLVTNLPSLSARGWTKVVQATPKPTSSNNNKSGRFIVQSREAKFLGWNVLPHVKEQCAMVVYMDGYLQPKTSWWFQMPSTLAKFQAIAKQVQNHSWGLSQVKQAYFDGLSTTMILQNLIRDRKDTLEQVNATLSWLKQQGDYQEVMTYYLNKYFAYDPNNLNYQNLSSWFWEHYTTYGGSWRDQPLWSYALHHFNCTPAVMTTNGVITRGGDLFETGGNLGWGKHTYT